MRTWKLLGTITVKSPEPAVAQSQASALMAWIIYCVVRTQGKHFICAPSGFHSRFDGNAL